MSMDYEKAYKEALERARQEIQKYPKMLNIYAKAFPELAESEDERIRKEIIFLLKHYSSKEELTTKYPIESMIAYLEKLKEQKPAEWSDEDKKWFNVVSQCGLTEGTIDWIRSLINRYYWKPSEEQMDALKNSAYGTYQNGDGPALRELYEQLKKLH